MMYYLGMYIIFCPNVSLLALLGKIVKYFCIFFQFTLVICTWSGPRSNNLLQYILYIWRQNYYFFIKWGPPSLENIDIFFVFLTFILFSIFRHFHDDDDDVEYNITSIQMVVQSENEEKFVYTGVTSVREFLSLRPSHHTVRTPTLHHHHHLPPPQNIPGARTRAAQLRATKLQCQFLNT